MSTLAQRLSVFSAEKYVSQKRKTSFSQVKVPSPNSVRHQTTSFDNISPIKNIFDITTPSFDQTTLFDTPSFAAPTIVSKYEEEEVESGQVHSNHEIILENKLKTTPSDPFGLNELDAINLERTKANLYRIAKRRLSSNYVIEPPKKKGKSSNEIKKTKLNIEPIGNSLNYSKFSFSFDQAPTKIPKPTAIMKMKQKKLIDQNIENINIPTHKNGIEKKIMPTHNAEIDAKNLNGKMTLIQEEEKISQVEIVDKLSQVSAFNSSIDFKKDLLETVPLNLSIDIDLKEDLLDIVPINSSIDLDLKNDTLNSAMNLSIDLDLKEDALHIAEIQRLTELLNKHKEAPQIIFSELSISIEEKQSSLSFGSIDCLYSESRSITPNQDAFKSKFASNLQPSSTIISRDFRK